MIWASFIVLILRSTARDEGGGAVAGVVVVPLLSAGLARCWAGAGLVGGATFGSEGFAGGATGGRGGGGALRSEASCGFGCCLGCVLASRIESSSPRHEQPPFASQAAGVQDECPLAVFAVGRAVAFDTQCRQRSAVPRTAVARALVPREGDNQTASFAGSCRTGGRRGQPLGDEQLPPL